MVQPTTLPPVHPQPTTHSADFNPGEQGSNSVAVFQQIIPPQAEQQLVDPQMPPEQQQMVVHQPPPEQEPAYFGGPFGQLPFFAIDPGA